VRRRAPREERAVHLLVRRRPRAHGEPGRLPPVPAGAGNRATARVFAAHPTVGPVDDPRERAADAVARRVTGSEVQRDRAPDPAGAPVPTGGTASASIGRAVRRARAEAGESLPGSVRRRLERGLGTDLAGVRIHTGRAAAEAAAALGAAAFTSDRDIFVGRGRYRPDTRSGEALLAHEAAHTVRRRGPVPAIQRSPETAVEDLVKTNPGINSITRRTINDPRFAKKHELGFPVSDATVAQVREALRNYRDEHPVAAKAKDVSYTGAITSAEMKTVLTGNSGGQSYAPRGDKVPHWSVEWSPPVKGLYTIKQVHYKVGEGRYFWWNKVGGGKATFSDSTMSPPDHAQLAMKVNAAREKFAPRIHVDLEDVPLRKPRS
jgi:hypothetical protein